MAIDNQVIRKPAEMHSSSVDSVQRDMSGISDELAPDEVYMSVGLLHHHDGGMGQIVWNDVQAIIAKNKYLRKGRAGQIPVPASASEGYNQHHHTSEFDGGVIAGSLGNHDHRDNAHGGFAFAVLHPATSVPHAVWEE